MVASTNFVKTMTAEKDDYYAYYSRLHVNMDRSRDAFACILSVRRQERVLPPWLLALASGSAVESSLHPVSHRES